MSRNWQQSRVSPLNTSTSKFGYAFDKTPRFRTTSKTLCDNFYNVSRNINSKNKGVGIGKGSKITFGDKNGYPSPNVYQLKSEFQDNKKGYRMRLGRQSLKYGGIFRKSESPDPARYHISSVSSSKSSRNGYTMRSKPKLQQPSYKKNPGPGQYKLSSTISATGIYSLSTVSNCLSPKITNSKPYNPSSKFKTPAPSDYNLDKQNINVNGNFYNSKYQASKARSFSKSKKFDDSTAKMKKRIPGPGSYQYFSEFGAGKSQI